MDEDEETETRTHVTAIEVVGVLRAIEEGYIRVTPERDPLEVFGALRYKSDNGWVIDIVKRDFDVALTYIERVKRPDGRTLAAFDDDPDGAFFCPCCSEFLAAADVSHATLRKRWGMGHGRRSWFSI